jgi:hypothetical protein
MAEIDDIMSVLRHRITGPFESGPPSPAISPVKHSAVVAMLRLAHPARDDSAVVGDEISQLFKRLALDRPELLEEVVAFLEHRTAEMNGDDGAGPRPTESVAPAALVPAAPTPQDDDAGKSEIMLLFDTQVLARVDADAKRIGISRTAWLHVAADERLECRR